MSNRKKFEVEVEGKKKAFFVERPDSKAAQAAHLTSARVFRQMVKPEDGKAGAMVRAALDRVMREQQLWDDARQAEYDGLVKGLLEAERRLARGGFPLKEAREVAVKMRKDRRALSWLRRDRDALDLQTAEAQAENAKFTFLVARCTKDEAGKPVYDSEEDYLNREKDPVGPRAAEVLGQLLYGLEPDWEKKLPENRFLLRHGLCDPQLRLLDYETRRFLVNEDGRRVDEKGRLVNDQGQLMDLDGNRLDEQGDYVMADAAPFTDDDGNPVVVDGDYPVAAPPVQEGEKSDAR